MTVEAQARTVRASAIPFPRLEHVWLMLVLAAVFIVPSVGTVIVVDLGWTLRAGEWMVQHHALLVDDPFTAAPHVAAQLNGQWLAQLAYYAPYAAGGLPLVIAANALVATAAFALLLAACRQFGARVRLACGCVALAYILSYSNLGARPQTLAYPLFAFFLLTLARAERVRNTRLWWALPPIAAAWANVHGSFVLGPLMLACSAAGAAWEGRSVRAAVCPLLALAGCGLAACLTPYGPGSLLYVARIGSNTIIRDFVTEWAPTSVATLEGAFFFVSLPLVAGLFLWSGARLRVWEWLVLAAFAWLAVSAVRSVVWWALIVAPILARALETRLARSPAARRRVPERPSFNLALLGMILVVMVFALPWFRPLNVFLPADKRQLLSVDNPTAAAAFLQQQSFEGVLFNTANWGGYLDWVLAPDQRPFLDTRIEIHPVDVWMDALWITFPTADWQALMDRYQIGYAILNVKQSPELIDAMRASPLWRLVYTDDQAAVFVRSPSPPPSS